MRAVKSLIVGALLVLVAGCSYGCAVQRVEPDGTPMNPVKSELVDLNDYFTSAETAVSDALDAKIIKPTDVSPYMQYVKAARSSLDDAGKLVKAQNFDAAKIAISSARAALNQLRPLALKAGYKKGVPSGPSISSIRGGDDRRVRTVYCRPDWAAHREAA